MPRFFFETSVTVTTEAPQIALVNPAASGVYVALKSVKIFGPSLLAIVVERYSVEASLSALGPAAPAPGSFETPGATSKVTVATIVSHTITEPSSSARTFSTSIYDEALGQALPIPDGIVATPGGSLMVDTSKHFDGTGPTITFQIEYDEEPLVLETTAVDGQVSAFGEALTAQLTPLAQLDFADGLSASTNRRVTGAGSVTTSGSLAVAATGASANSRASLAARRYSMYRPGQGELSRFTAVFTAGAANSTQLAGPGDDCNGFFFGYNGTAFGVLRRSGGEREVRTLTITTASATNENVTVTLEGATKTVAVTNSGVTTTTASQIAAGDFTTTGSGWDAYQTGSTVVFVARLAGARAGTFSLTATTAVGAFATTLAGASPTDTWTAQSAWNVDRCDGFGKGLLNLDPTKLNVFQVRYQYLGGGAIQFHVETAVKGVFALVHEIQYAGSATTPSVATPNFPLSWIAENASNTSNISVSSASGAAFTEGNVRLLGRKGSTKSSKTGITTATPIMSIRNPLFVNGKNNKVQAHMWELAAAANGTRVSFLDVIANGTLTGANWSPVDSVENIVDVDTTATAISAGRVLCTLALGANGNSLLLFPEIIDRFLAPGDVITFVGSSAANAEIGLAPSWVEDR